MCKQELIWCSCGHGEFLPIQACSNTIFPGTCWVVVYGNHNVTIDIPCSHCSLRRQPSLPSPWPPANTAAGTPPVLDVNLDFTDFDIDPQLLESGQGDAATGELWQLDALNTGTNAQNGSR